MPVEYTGKSTKPDNEIFSAIGGWPGNNVNFACAKNRGRSVIGRACFKIAFPEVANVTSFAISKEAKEVFDGKPLDTDVKSVLEEYGYPVDDQFTYMGDVPMASDAVSIYFVDRFIREHKDLEWSFYQDAIKCGQMLICIPVDDPPVDFVEPKHRREIIRDTFMQIRNIVFFDLKHIVTHALKGEFIRIEGVVYPFGEPNYMRDLLKMSTFRYLRQNAGWTGDIG